MKKFLLDIVLCILGACIIYFILYIRLFRDVLPSDLHRNLYENKYYFILSIYVILFLLFSYFTIIVFKTLLYDYFKIGSLPTSSRFLRHFAILGKLYTESLEHLAIFLSRNIKIIDKNLYDFCKKIGLFCYNNLFTYNKMSALIIITHILPKSIFLGAFIVDVMIFHKFEYVYKVSFLMLIPLIEAGFYHLFIENFCQSNFSNLDEVIEIRGAISQELIKTEVYLKHSISVDFSTTSPLKDTEFDVVFSDEAEKTKSDDMLILYVEFLNNVLKPITKFNIFYKALKCKLLATFHAIFFLGYASIWFYILVYSW